MTPLQRRLRPVLVTLAGAALLLIPAFLNGYPLVNSDCGTYLRSGLIPEMPGDRPIAYGLLLRVGSLLGLSLWIAVAVQAVIMTWLVLKTVQCVLQMPYGRGFWTLAVLALTTPLSWVASEIIPDVCTPMALLAAVLLLMGSVTKGTRAMLLLTFGAAVGTHISHLVILGGALVLVLLARRWMLPLQARRAALRTGGLLLAIVGLAGLSMIKPIRHSKHMFTMAALIDGGILQPYLEEACPTERYRLCAYKDGLSPDPNHLLWDAQSPAALEGGWDATRPEYNRIISRIHRTPKYLWARVRVSFRNTVRQLCSFGIGDGNFPFGAGSHVHAAVTDATVADGPLYLRAWQHTTTRHVMEVLRWPNRIVYAVVISGTVALLFFWMLARRRLPSALRFLILFSVLGIGINAWSCGTASNVLGRYGCRVAWMLPFCALLCAQALRQKKPVPAARTLL